MNEKIYAYMCKLKLTIYPTEQQKKLNSIVILQDVEMGSEVGVVYRY